MSNFPDSNVNCDAIYNKIIRLSDKDRLNRIMDLFRFNFNHIKEHPFQNLIFKVYKFHINIIIGIM
jgi:hypothetical protein